MIYQDFVPEECQDRSRRNYTKFILVNGFSYCCLGETVIILLAVQLKAADWVISALGAMCYFGYTLLLLGRRVTSRVGAAKSQHFFWVARNISSLLVAGAVPVCLYVGQLPAMAMMLLGAFLFYGFRAAGYVMAGPLVGDITTEENRAIYISSNSSASYVLGVVALVIINLLVLFTHNNLWTLTAIVIAGAFLGIHASGYLKKVDETSTLRESCREPLVPQLAALLKMDGIKRLLFCNLYVNLAFIMLMPISLLTLKKGYHISDTGAVAFSIFQWISAAIVPYFIGKIMAKIGPRKVLIAAGGQILLIAIFWILLPHFYPEGKVPFYLLFLPFFIAGVCNATMNNALTHYYLESVAKNLLVTYAILSSVIGGAVAGLAGMAVTGVILSWLETHAAGGVSGASYAVYFIWALVILLPSVVVYASLKPLPLELRRKSHCHLAAG